MIDKEELIRTAPGTKTKIKNVLIEKRTGRYPDMDHGLASLTLGSGDAQIWHSCGMLDAPDRREANTRRTVS
jgi:hypothetical protein